MAKLYLPDNEPGYSGAAHAFACFGLAAIVSFDLYFLWCSFQACRIFGWIGLLWATPTMITLSTTLCVNYLTRESIFSPRTFGRK